MAAVAARVCARCGRPAPALVRGLCPSCFAEAYGAARLPARVSVEVCRYCGSVRVGGRWEPAGSFEAAVEAAVAVAVRRARPVEPLSQPEPAGVEYETVPDWTTRVVVVLRASAPGGAVVESRHPLTVQLKPSICPTCKTRVSGEYDTVLQLRGMEPGALERLAGEAVERAGVAGDTVDLISHREGVDLYFTHRGAASRVVRVLRRMGLVESVRSTAEEVGVTGAGRVRVRRTVTVRLRETRSGHRDR